MTVIDGVNQARAWLVQEPWRPFADVSGWQITDGKSEIDKQARELADEVKRQEQALADAVRGRSEAQAAVVQAHADFQAEARDGDAQKAADLLTRRNSLESIAREIHDNPDRQTAIADRVSAAKAALREFVDEHWREFLAAIEADARKTAQEYSKAAAEIDARLTPLRREHDRLARAARVFVGRIEPFTADDVPSDYGTPSAFCKAPANQKVSATSAAALRSARGRCSTPRADAGSPRTRRRPIVLADRRAPASGDQLLISL